MHGVYKIVDGKLAYEGNAHLKPIVEVAKTPFRPVKTENLLTSLESDRHFQILHHIDNAVFDAAVDYFRSIKASWCNLPLTTKMISSPGEIYAGKKLDYTTDALPIQLDWFDSGSAYLAESSQFYLELRLLIDQLSGVYSIYNSFRKEPADFSHLSEFQHIEFEGHIEFEENIRIYVGLLRHITNHIVKFNAKDLSYYLSEKEIEGLLTTFDSGSIETIRFTDAMDILAVKLSDSKYKSHSLKHFGAFEEVALTRLLGKHCNVVEFPLEEIPFYHDASFSNADGKTFAKNADLILFGYRETVGSGQRITDFSAIKEKARFFNLPPEDYEPYLDLRASSKYIPTCGFGLGWQRYTQWLLKMPYIWNVSHIPRGQFAPKP